MARTDAEKVEYAVGLVRQAEAEGLISREAAQVHLRELGVEQQTTTVTVTFQATGDVRGALASRNGQVGSYIEEALAPTASRVGLRIVPGSAQVVAS